MSFRRLVSDFMRILAGRQALATAALAALVLLLAAPAPLQAGKCPPCSGEADECAFACCVYQDCGSPASPSCVGWCALGYLVSEIFEDGDTGPAFKSVPGQSQVECHGDNRVGVITLPPVGSRNTTKRLEIALVSISDRKFLATPEDVVSVVVEVATKQEYETTGGKPRWSPIGSAAFDTRAGAWVLNWSLSAYNQPEYVVRAQATRRDGRAQQARGLAASATY
jgi:hypothetical protein